MLRAAGAPTMCLAAALATLSITSDARAADVALSNVKAEGRLNYKALPGEEVGVYFNVRNESRSTTYDVRANIYFCRERDPDTCYGDPARSRGHEVRIDTLKGQRGTNVHALVKVPPDARAGMRYMRIILSSSSGRDPDSADNEAYASFELAEKVCTKTKVTKKRKKKVRTCVAWRDPRMDGGPAPVR